MHPLSSIAFRMSHSPFESRPAPPIGQGAIDDRFWCEKGL
jgi:hypothetical protein